MKIISAVILVGICLSLFAPVTIVRSFTESSETAYILTLNVCDNAGTGLASNFDIPCVLEFPCKLAIFENSQLHDISNPPFTPLLIAFQAERPPQV